MLVVCVSVNCVGKSFRKFMIQNLRTLMENALSNKMSFFVYGYSLGWQTVINYKLNRWYLLHILAHLPPFLLISGGNLRSNAAESRLEFVVRKSKFLISCHIITTLDCNNGRITKNTGNIEPWKKINFYFHSQLFQLRLFTCFCRRCSYLHKMQKLRHFFARNKHKKCI